MANIRDLARMAGVSVSTVSRVLNNHPYVSEEKRTAVLQAIEKSSYHKNINAVNLSRGKTMLMGVVVPYSDHPYFSLMIKGIAKLALDHNYKLVLIQTDYREDRELEALEMLREKQIDSLIICSRTCSMDIVREYAGYGHIVLCENNNDEAVSVTYVNHYRAFYRALTYLYQNGHVKIGYCIGRKTGVNSLQRQAAYRDFVSKYNLGFNEDYIIGDCLYFEDGEKVVNKLREMASPPTALLVTSDQVAAGIVTCCQKLDIAIPGELAIIGFDNQPIAKMMDITTVKIPIEEMGSNLFLQAFNGDKSRKEMQVRLIERGTV
ncbi:LacI family transcriptional regulator [Mesobacillus campisalis]|uniref:LacI family transcriptional regulator n=1 Tax=Mesobacillus campisalis TaxID=1408103 RepID=A0A0M2SP82_9BACI|nr:LacI family DNA-binding transcriptional regulator [Mesobacillus campisalis]KKK36379.1 LacI family transcriptional regulator [Mesobacillus campisalis]